MYKHTETNRFMLTDSDLRDLGLSVGQHRVIWGYLIFFFFWTDIFANLSLELVYSQLEQFGQGGGGLMG